MMLSPLLHLFGERTFMPDFSKLARFSPRCFVPDDFDPADWPQNETLYDKLIETNLATVSARMRDGTWSCGRALPARIMRWKADCGSAV